MSYRKPVPTYIPSPPSSPPQPTFPPSAHLDLEVPPLPPNWREALNQVDLLPSRQNAKSCQLLPAVTGEYIEMDMAELASSVMSGYPKGGNLIVHGDKVALPGTRSTSNVPWTQRRRLHQQYRPPTPPIPSQHKSPRSLLNSDNNSEISVAQNVHRRIDHFGLYHDYPRGGPGASSLKISPSFITDKTMGSFNTSNSSMGWFQGMITEELSNYPSLLNHKHDRHLHRIAGDTSESVNPSYWKSLGAWAKKLWNFVIICK